MNKSNILLILATTLCSISNIIIACVDSEYDTTVITIPRVNKILSDADTQEIDIKTFSRNDVGKLLFCEHIGKSWDPYMHESDSLSIRNARKPLEALRSYLQHPAIRSYFAMRCARAKTPENLTKMLKRCDTQSPHYYVNNYLSAVKEIVSEAVKKQEAESTTTPAQTPTEYDLNLRVDQLEQLFACLARNSMTQDIIAEQLAAQKSPATLKRLAQSEISPNQDYNDCVKELTTFALAKKHSASNN